MAHEKDPSKGVVVEAGCAGCPGCAELERVLSGLERIARERMWGPKDQDDASRAVPVQAEQEAAHA